MNPAAWGPLLTGALAACGGLAMSCGHSSRSVIYPTNDDDPWAPPVTAASPAAAAPLASASSEARALPPPPVIVTPMPGEPDAAALTDTQPEAASCAVVLDQVVEAEVARMRETLDQGYARWKEDQMDCWRAEQERQRELKYGNPWGWGIGQSWGSGGLGLSGIGEGGGGIGFGSGHGRLGGSHAARAPTVRMGAVKAAASASTTNNQVTGVDEADIVKHDGRYVYFAVNGALRIAEAMNPRLVSVTPLGGEARMLFVENGRAVAYVAEGQPPRRRCTYGYDCEFAGDGTRTRIVVYDVSNPAPPRPVRELKLTGSLMAARRIGNAVHTVVSDGDPAVGVRRYAVFPPTLGTCDGTQFKTAWQKFNALKLANEQQIRANFQPPTLEDAGRKTELCASALRTRIHDGGAFTSVISFDLTAPSTPARTVTLASRPGAVFASLDSLYVAVPHFKRDAGSSWYSFYGAHDEISDVHRFAIGDDPAKTRYVGSGVVPGRVLNQFSMDEWSGYLRIATTRGHAPDPQAESAVSILATAPGGNLVRVGSIEHIAPSEDIRSVRFDDERGYVVTFKKTDPLFVLDLYDPQQPKILGELKIPGFSTYLHRIDRNHLLSIGFDADDHGDFAYFDGVILQLFDVSNPTDPKLMHKAVIGTRGSSSEALTDHLAFNYFPERGLLGVPMTICAGGDDGRFGQNMMFSGLLVYDVSIEGGFRQRGGVNHGEAGATCNRWWSQAGSTVKRSIFLDDLVYSIALDRAKVQRLDALGADVAELPLR